MSPKILLMTAHHKSSPSLEVFKKYFSPIHVGKKISAINLNILSDDIGINISEKNKNYCELTACYWAQNKLDAEYEYIGLMHYRRIFTTRKFYLKTIKKLLGFFLRKVISCIRCNDPTLNFDCIFIARKMATVENISRELNDYLQNSIDKFDIILPKKNHFSYLTLEKQFVLNHNTDDFLIFKKILEEKYNFLIASFEEIKYSHSFYTCNMYIMKREYYKEYHELLFNILFEMEKVIDFSNKNEYQQRLFGFISERFLNVYIHFIKKNKRLSVLELNTVFIK